ncbi:DNA repair protein RecO [Pelomonas sp. Root1237]|uniref:DNA repair protein RecO n=1 Tax=Pelomonas sp. Root1237 TaxID=1736434 RepID=UPI0006F21128|nr:DNA repair protein RecO [Pelomonas sp. Root1237]KQV86518.1 DNA repair protein RecO [Pelomonas sp. Root1237]
MRLTRPPAVQQAYVLHQHDWSESSLILDLFTRESGRLAVAAKGAKRPYSQLRAVLLPLQRISVSLSKPAKAEGGEVQTLRSAEWGGGATLPAGAALFSGYYLNELLMKLLARHDPHPRLFDAYADTLAHLAEGDAALRAFEIRLLAELGLLPDLSVVTTTQTAIDPVRRYQLSPESGLIPPTSDASLPGTLLIQLQAALLHGSPAALRQACAVELQGLKTTLRGLLHYHLGHQQLRTRSLMVDVQQLLDGARVSRS